MNIKIYYLELMGYEFSYHNPRYDGKFGYVHREGLRWAVGLQKGTTSRVEFQLIGDEITSYLIFLNTATISLKTNGINAKYDVNKTKVIFSDEEFFAEFSSVIRDIKLESLC